MEREWISLLRHNNKIVTAARAAFIIIIIMLDHTVWLLVSQSNTRQIVGKGQAKEMGNEMKSNGTGAVWESLRVYILATYPFTVVD